VEITVYLPHGAGWIYMILLVHVVISMELVVLLPFTKFAHAVYRPLALFIHNMYRPAAGQKEA
jgi:nitrate reductase gamma subunit